MAESKGNVSMSRTPLGTWDLQRRDTIGDPLSSPFQFMRRMTDEMDRVFDRVFGDFGGSRRSVPTSAFGDVNSAPQAIWAPRIEAFQNDSRFVVRAELPGLKKEDVNVNVTDQAIILEGQRKSEQEENREGFYHSERSYGSFYRAIPLPEGTITDSAEARFKDGVLEVTLQAPPSDVRRGRKLEIK